jgi:hypothetical protein
MSPSNIISSFPTTTPPPTSWWRTINYSNNNNNTNKQLTSSPTIIMILTCLALFGIYMMSSKLNSIGTAIAAGTLIVPADMEDASWGWLATAAFGSEEEQTGAVGLAQGMYTEPPVPPLLYDENGNEQSVDNNDNSTFANDNDDDDSTPNSLIISPSRHSNITQSLIRVTEGLLPIMTQLPFTRGIHIITTFYKGDYRHARFMEIVTCLKRNLRNKFVTAVHTLWEDKDPIDFIPEPTLRAKLIRVNYGTQPTYKDLFDYAQLTLGRGAVAIVTNSDIYFDESLRCVVPVTPDRRAYNATRQHLVYALSRHPSPPCASRHDMCDEYIGSHDAFIFALPLAKRIAPRLDFTQNHIGAENVVIWELKYSRGYIVRNPCHVVRAMHLHCTSERHYHGVTISRGRYRIGNVDRHGSVSSSTLPKCGQVIY